MQGVLDKNYSINVPSFKQPLRMRGGVYLDQVPSSEKILHKERKRFKQKHAFL